MKQIQFYFDVISPYVWLASKLMPEFEQKYQVEFIWRPVLFAGLLNAHGNLGPAEVPAKRFHTLREAIRWAEHYGLPYEGPPQHPFNPLKALRLLTTVEDNSVRAQLGSLLLQAIWEQGLDATQDETLLKLVKTSPLREQIFAEKLLEQITTPQIKAKLRKNTESAVAQGVFGVPSFVVDGEVFWGHDRLILLADYLQGKIKIDSEKFHKILNRPRGADRTLIRSNPTKA